MQDRFKFRAWDKEQGKYVDDDDLCFDTGGTWDSVYDLLKFENRFYTIEQCTGLKDKNGKLIYEGDIVDDGEQYTKIIFEKSCFCYDSGNGYYDDLAFYHTHCEIVGNIHENPELLEDNK